MYGLWSSVRWASNETYAVVPSKCDASTRETCVSFGTPFTFPATFFHVAPPSRLTCTLPSLVPTQRTPGTTDDSLIVTMLLYDAAPSCFEAIGAVPGTPMIGRSLRPMLFVRSGEAVQVSPRSYERNSRSAPR